MYVLGLNAYHGDAAACLLRDGAIIAAAEEERFRRVKHWAGFPAQAVRYCLAEAGIGLGDVAHVAINSNPRANLARKVGYALYRRPALGLVLARLRNQGKRSSVEEELREACSGDRFSGTVHRVEHHLAHLASCFYGSPYPEAVARWMASATLPARPGGSARGPSCGWTGRSFSRIHWVSSTRP